MRSSCLALLSNGLWLLSLAPNLSPPLLSSDSGQKLISLHGASRCTGRRVGIESRQAGRQAGNASLQLRPKSPDDYSGHDMGPYVWVPGGGGGRG